MKRTPIFILFFLASANFIKNPAYAAANSSDAGLQNIAFERKKAENNADKNTNTENKNAEQFNIAKHWKLIEIYQLDTAQHLIKTEELSAEKHRKQQVFHCHEMGLEYQALIFTADSLVYRLERHLENESVLYKGQRYSFKKNRSALTFMTTKEEIQVLHLAPKLLILGRQKNLIEVYIPIDENDEEHRPAIDYIWQYYQLFFPKRFKRFEEG